MRVTKLTIGTIVTTIAPEIGQKVGGQEGIRTKDSILETRQQT